MNNSNNNTNHSASPDKGGRFQIDFEEFAHYFEDEDISEDAARAWLAEYYRIALEIMALGFGFHPVQQTKKTCGQVCEISPKQPVALPERVYLSEDDITEHFDMSFGPPADRGHEDSSHDTV